jgi:acyl-CoA synthetase (AMP-forming)/AMP-acid ligase II
MVPVFENLSDAIFHYAQTRPDAAALHDGSTTLSFREFAGFVGRAAVHLHDIGVKPGELVGLSLPTGAPHVILLFALLRLGAVPVDIPMRRAVKLDPFKLFGVKRVLAAPGIAVADATVHIIDADWRAAIETKSGDHRFAGPADQLFLFNLTSGSTGAPRGVITSGREWSERYRSAAALLPEIITAERPPNLLALGEISFSGFFFFIANQLCVGGPVVLIGLSESADHLIAAMNKLDDVAFLVTPPMCRELLAKAPQQGLLFPKVRAMVVGAAPMFPDEKRAFAARLTPNIVEVYGNAATGFITALRPSEFAQKGETVGRVAPGIAVDIVDPRGRMMAPGAIGHIRCRGSGISQRFFGPNAGPAKGPEGFRDGSYYPGDLGAIDRQGYLHLKGRVSELISRRGITLYPPEIEAVLAAHPGVAEAAVIGVPGGGGDEQVIAVVVPRGAPDLDAVAAHCRARLPAEKLPNQLFSAETLPRTGPGKIDKPALKAGIIKRLKSAAPKAASAAPSNSGSASSATPGG